MKKGPATLPHTTAHPGPTERLYFRAWRPEDLPLALLLFGDARVTTYIGGPFTEAQTRERLAREMEQLDQHRVQYWPVFLRASDEFAGCCGLRPRDPALRIFEIGFYLRPQFWGRGLASEAARAAATYAFDALAARSLFAGHHPRNTASRRALEKLGMRYTHDELYAPTGLLHPSYIREADK